MDQVGEEWRTNSTKFITSADVLRGWTITNSSPPKRNILLAPVTLSNLLATKFKTLRH